MGNIKMSTDEVSGIGVHCIMLLDDSSLRGYTTSAGDANGYASMKRLRNPDFKAFGQRGLESNLGI